MEVSLWLTNVPQGVPLDEWMKLVTECRQSGLTDAAWCTEHGSLPVLFTMRLRAFVKEPARYLIQLESQYP